MVFTGSDRPSQLSDLSETTAKCVENLSALVEPTADNKSLSPRVERRGPQTMTDPCLLHWTCPHCPHSTASGNVYRAMLAVRTAHHMCSRSNIRQQTLDPVGKFLRTMSLLVLQHALTLVMTCIRVSFVSFYKNRGCSLLILPPLPHHFWITPMLSIVQ